MTNDGDDYPGFDAGRKEEKNPSSTTSGQAPASGNSGQRPDLRLATNSESAADIARSYVARGWKPIPIPIGEKGCKDNGWENIVYDANRHFDGLKNIGVQLGPVSGGLTDVDLDVPEAIKLAPYFLPCTAATFGRQSKPESHWLYLIDDPEASAAIKLVDETEKKKAIIELRMGGGGKGALTVFPGSTHESGERVEWVKAGDPAKSSCAILKTAVHKIAIATLLARHWPQNSRHEASLRCGGFLARAGWTPDDIQDFMRPVQIVAGVYIDADIRNGCSAAFDAATLHVTEGRGYGLPAFKEFFGDEVTKVVAKLLHYRERDQVADLERLNEKYCIMPFGGKVRVLSFERDPEFERIALTFYSAADFQLRYANILIDIGERKPIGLGKWWLNHPLRMQYDGLMFEPGAPKVIENRDGRWRNMWEGWGFEPRQGQWPLFRKHIFEVLANGNKEHEDYIIKWSAHTLQHPDQRAETALAFCGQQGSGKGVYGRAMCEVFGQHGIQINSHRQLVGNFNRHLLNCVLLFSDEAFWPGDRSAEGTLKRIVTEPTLMIEPKGFDSTQHKNRLHIIMASNQDWVVPVAIEDRRFAVFDVSNKYALNKAYFRPLYHELYQQGGLAAFLYDMLAMDLGDWHPRDEVPNTTARRHQKELSLAPEDQWWFQMLLDGKLPVPDYTDPSRSRIRDLFEDAGKTVPAIRRQSKLWLSKVLHSRGCIPCRVGSDNSRGWRFPPLKEAREAWDKRMPGTNWEAPNEWEADQVETVQAGQEIGRRGDQGPM